MTFLHRHKAKRTVIDGISFPSRTEAEIRKEICDFLKTFPDDVIFTVMAKPRGKFVSSSWPPKGYSDIPGAIRKTGGKDGATRFYYAVPFFLEVKTPTGKIYQEQVQFIDRAKAMGCIAGFVTSVQDVRGLLGL